MFSIVKEHFIEIARIILAIVGICAYFYMEYLRKKEFKEFGKETQAEVINVTTHYSDDGLYHLVYYKFKNEFGAVIFGWDKVQGRYFSVGEIIRVVYRRDTPNTSEIKLD